jgi:hypothetical protein
MLRVGNFSDNQFSGFLVQLPSNLGSLDISRNHMSGSVTAAFADQRVRAPGCAALQLRAPGPGLGLGLALPLPPLPLSRCCQRPDQGSARRSCVLLT